MSRLGYETTLVVGSSDSTEGSMDDWARASGAKLHVIPSFQASIDPFKDALTFIKLVALFWGERPDLVHTHTFKAGILGRLAAWITGVPIIVHTYHGHLLSGYWSPLRTKLVCFAEKIVGKMTTQIITVSSRVAQDLVAAGLIPEKKIEVIELGFDMLKLTEQLSGNPSLRTDLGLSADAQLVGIVGRLVPIKSVDLFLRAMAPLLAKNSQLHVAVIGDGSEAPKLRDLASQISPTQIHFCGWRLPVMPDLPDLDLCICSSKNEGTSVSIIEAVIAGVPVISTRVGGMADLLGDGQWGDLVAYDELALRDRISAVLEILNRQEGDPEREKLRLRCQQAATFFKNRFSVERLLKNIDTIYSKLSRRARDPFGEPVSATL